MTGFDREWRERLLGFHAHRDRISISPLRIGQQSARWLSSRKVLSAAPLIDGLVLLKPKRSCPLLYGIDPTNMSAHA